MRRKILLTVLIFFILVIILLVGAFFFTQTQHFRDFARRTTESIVSSTTGQVFTIGSLEGNFFNNIKLTEVSFIVEGESFVTVKEVSLDYSIPHMLDGSLLFSKIIPIYDLEIHGLDVNIVKYKDGTWNFAKIGNKEEERMEKSEEKENTFPEWSIILKQFLLRQGEIKIEDRESGTLSAFTIPEIDLSVNLIDIYREIDLNLKNADVYATSPKLRVEGLSVKALYSEEKAEIKDLNVALNGSEIKLNASAQALNTSPEFSYEASVENYELENLGIISVSTKGSGIYKDKKELLAQASIDIPVSVLLGRKLTGAIEKISVNGSSLEIGDGSIQSDLGEVLISGSGNLSRLITKEGANNFSLDVSLNDIKTKEIFSLLKEQGETEAKGFNTELGTTLNATLNAEADWVEFGDIMVKGHVEKFEIKGEGAGDLKLSGLVEYTKTNLGIDLTSSLSNVDLSQILDNNQLASQITSKLYIKGRIPLEGDFLPNLSAEVKGDIEPSSIFGIDIKSGDVDISLENEFLDVKTLAINSDEFTITAQGNKADAKGVDLSYDLEVKDLSFISNLVPDTEFAGAMKATGYVKGEITSPSLSIDLEASELSVKEGIGAQSVSLKGSGTIDLANPDLDAELKVENATVNNRAIQSVNIKAQSESEDIKLSADIVENDQFKYEIDTILSGLNTEEKKIEISDLKLFLEDTQLDNRESIVVTIAPEQLKVENFNLYHNKSSATVDANINYDGGISVQARLNELSLDDITKALQFNNPIQGTISANLNAQGTMESPQINADIKTEGFAYEQFQNDLSLDLTYLAQSLNLKFLVTEGASTIMDATGSANLDLNLKNLGENIKKGTFNLSLSSPGVNLSPVASLVDEIEKSEGTLIVDLRASGSLTSPSVNGEIRLDEATFKIKSLRNEFTFTNALIEMNGQRGVFKNMEIVSEGGTGVFEGDISLSPLSYNINGTMDKFIIKPQRIKSALSGDINMSGDSDKLEVAGKIIIRRSRITIPDQPDREIEEIQFVDEDGGEEIRIGDGKKTDFFEDNVALNLEVKMTNNNWVRGRGANIELRGDLDIQKKLSESVRIVGDIRTVRGTYENFGKLFRIEEGNVSFSGGTEINPFLDIRALYRVSDINIYIEIGGRAQSPEIKLSSNPSMTETDIVSYLLFGVSSSDIGSNERQSVQNVATGVAGGIAAAQLAKLLGPAVSLDVVSIDANQVEVGKYLTQDLYIAYRRAASESIIDSTNITTNKVLVEYQIFKNITIDADIGGENSGADLFYNFNY
jgi:translocation and assembly module TamB